MLDLSENKIGSAAKPLAELIDYCDQMHTLRLAKVLNACSVSGPPCS